MRFQPQLTGWDGRIDTGPAPPSGFIAVAMQLAMMAAAQGDRELVADLAAQRPALREAQVMGVAGFTTADQTSLLRHEAHMVAITDASGLGMGKNRFVDGLAAGLPSWVRRIRRHNGFGRLVWRRGFGSMFRGWWPFGGDEWRSS